MHDGEAPAVSRQGRQGAHVLDEQGGRAGSCVANLHVAAPLLVGESQHQAAAVGPKGDGGIEHRRCRGAPERDQGLSRLAIDNLDPKFVIGPAQHGQAAPVRTEGGVDEAVDLRIRGRGHRDVQKMEEFLARSGVENGDTPAM
jgi:hypothetical protein